MKADIALFHALIAVVLWSTVAAAVKLTLRSINSFQIIFYVTLFSSIFLFFVVIFTGKTSYLRKYIHNSKIPFIGFFGMFITPFFFYLAIEFSTAIEANILNYTWPIFIIILAAFILREKITSKSLLGLFIGFVGAYFVIAKGILIDFKSLSLIGDAFALIGALSWAIFSIINRKYKYEQISAMFLYSVCGFVFAFILNIFTGFLQVPAVYDIIGTFYIGVIATATAFVFWMKAISKGEVASVVNLVYLVPFISVIFIYLLTGEEILISQIFGLILIVGGILIQIKK